MCERGLESRVNTLLQMSFLNQGDCSIMWVNCLDLLFLDVMMRYATSRVLVEAATTVN